MTEYFSVAQGDGSWALGRFVAPSSRLAELWKTVGGTVQLQPMRVSALIGTGTADDVDAIERFNRAAGRRARVEAVEAKAASASIALAVLAAIPPAWTRYLEVEPGEGMSAALDVIKDRGAFAKLRTGGVTPDAFPDPDAVLDFLEGCARRRLPFKATAGLHHAVRGEFRLTYDPDSARGIMYGYLNLFAAAALLWAGRPRSDARAVLLEDRPGEVRVSREGLRIGGQTIPVEAISAMRSGFAHGFGSCSFREPLDELRVLADS